MADKCPAYRCSGCNTYWPAAPIFSKKCPDPNCEQTVWYLNNALSADVLTTAEAKVLVRGYEFERFVLKREREQSEPAPKEDKELEALWDLPAAHDAEPEGG